MESGTFAETGVITVTDGLRTVSLPFREGESVLSVFQRYLRFPAPCSGRGFCGQCGFDRVMPDGSCKPELACMFTAREMTVKIPLVRLKEPETDEK